MSGRRTPGRHSMFILRERKITQLITNFYDNSYVQTLQNANFAATVAKSI